MNFGGRNERKNIKTQNLKMCIGKRFIVKYVSRSKIAK